MPLLLPLAALLIGSVAPPPPPRRLSRRTAQAVFAKAAPPAVPLAFGQFFTQDGTGSRPSPALLALDGRRVRLTGFMAQQEEPFPGVFYLCPHPTFCDEEGGGDADIPALSAQVTVRSMAGKIVPFRPGVLSATGTLSVGRRTDAQGHSSFVRLTLDGPADVPPADRLRMKAMLADARKASPLKPKQGPHPARKASPPSPVRTGDPESGTGEG